MIRKLWGFLLVTIGILSAYVFGVLGAKNGGGLMAPFYNIEARYPYSAFVLVLSVSATLGGIVIFATKFPRKVTADILLVNSLVMLSTLSVILLGLKSNQNGIIGFGVVLLGAELLTGIILIVLSLMEKPKAWISLISGALLHITITSITAAAVFSGI